MPNFDTFNAVADVEIIIACVLSVIFTASYMIFFNWRKTSAGRAIMYLFLSWVFLTAISLAAVLVDPGYWGRPIFRVIGWGFVIFALGNLIRVLLYNFRVKAKPLNLEPRHTQEVPVVKRKEDDDGARY